MDNETGGAYIENFRQFLREHSEDGQENVEAFYKTLESGSDTAESVSDYGSRKPKLTGIAHWIDSSMDNWEQKYGKGVLGEAIKEIEYDFPELSNPRYFYWTQNADIQGEIEEAFNRFEAALSEAADRIEDVLEEKYQEAKERDAYEAEQRANRERARSQAEKALEIAEKFAGAESPAASPQKSGLSSFVKFVCKTISNSIKSIFRRGK